jgi:undecaprenyl-phosphate 4-deoxy-4-formamido-L-arabinose transferase
VNISVVVPVYNSSRTLTELTAALHPVLDELAYEYELILVNDCSRDNSAEVMKQLAAKYSWVHPVNLARNFGQHNALLCGIRAAKYELVATLDDDLQNPPEELKHVVAKLQEGYDVVYGVPAAMQHGFLRNMASQVTKKVLQGAMGADNASKISAYRVFRTHLREAFKDYRSPYVNIDGLLTWGTNRFSWVLIDHRERQVGVSNYTLAKLINHAMNMITGFTTLPLRLATMYGFACIIFGICVLTWVIGRYLFFGDCVEGFPFLASITVIFAGAQLFSLGIIGEYMARMYTRSTEQPPYVVLTQVEETARQVATR